MKEPKKLAEPSDNLIMEKFDQYFDWETGELTIRIIYDGVVYKETEKMPSYIKTKEMYHRKMEELRLKLIIDIFRYINLYMPQPVLRPKPNYADIKNPIPPPFEW